MELANSKAKDSKDLKNLFLVQGIDHDGQNIYCIVLVDSENLKEFIKASNKNNFYPAELGHILNEGFGKPSENVIEKIKEELKIDSINFIECKRDKSFLSNIDVRAFLLNFFSK